MATSSIRWLVVQELVDRLRAHPSLGGVLVEPGWPGEEFLRPDTIFVGGITGTIALPTLMAGRHQADDKFSFPVAYQVKDRRTLDDAMERTIELGDAVHDVIVDATTFDGMDGLVSVEPGEREDDARRFTEGIYGFGAYTLNVHARLL